MNDLGYLYQHGQDVAQNFTEARRWCEEAVAQDNATALNNLGSLHQNGRGVAQDYAEARRW